jgi:hypothetical protein
MPTLSLIKIAISCMHSLLLLQRSCNEQVEEINGRQSICSPPKVQTTYYLLQSIGDFTLKGQILQCDANANLLARHLSDGAESVMAPKLLLADSIDGSCDVVEAMDRDGSA